MDDATKSLLTEHFSYTPLSLVDDVINSINNLIYQAISSLEAGLLSTPPERLGFSHATNGSTIPDTDEDGNVVYPEARLEIEDGLHKLETLLEATVDKAFDKFEIIVLRNSFRVDDDLLGWIRLKHYELRSILSAVKGADGATSAKQEGGSETSALPTNKDLDLSFLTESPAAKQLRVGAAVGSNTKHTPLTTNTTFILSQLPALQGLLKQLRPKLATLPKSAEATEADSKRDQRKEYIESRIRLHLERTGQLGVGSDGNPVVAGRKIDISEAQALEAVTGLLTQGDKMSE
ncbi:unnamed protein product [Aspergillus oryzae]|nr:unnamed protein product [Aspergillus oryzae]